MGHIVKVKSRNVNVEYFSPDETEKITIRIWLPVRRVTSLFIIPHHVYSLVLYPNQLHHALSHLSFSFPLT